MRKNCSSVPESLLKFEAEGREFAKFLSSLEQFILTVKCQDIQFLKQNAFQTYSWRFLRSDTLNQLKLKSVRIIEI